MVRFAAWLAVSIVLRAQNLCINSGGPAIAPSQPNGPCAFIADQYSTTGTIWGPGSPGYIQLPAGILADLRYGPSFNYDIPLAVGSYSVKFDLIEPTQSAVNLRRFTINANGIQSDPLDLFALTGGVGVPYSLVMNSVPVLNGNLHIIFAATIRSAVVAGIEITLIPPPPPPPPPLIGTRKPCVNPIDAPNPIMVMMFGDGSCSEIKILQPGDTAQNVGGRHVVRLRTLNGMYGVKVIPSVNGQVYYWPPDADPETPVTCFTLPIKVRDTTNPVEACYTQIGQRWFDQSLK